MIPASDLANDINSLLCANGFTTRIDCTVDPVHAIVVMGYRGPEGRPDWIMGIHIQTGGPVAFVKKEVSDPKIEVLHSGSELTGIIKKMLNDGGYSYKTRLFGRIPGIIFYANIKPDSLFLRIKKMFGVIS